MFISGPRSHILELLNRTSNLSQYLLSDVMLNSKAIGEFPEATSSLDLVKKNNLS